MSNFSPANAQRTSQNAQRGPQFAIPNSEFPIVYTPQSNQMPPQVTIARSSCSGAPIRTKSVKR